MPIRPGHRRPTTVRFSTPFARWKDRSRAVRGGAIGVAAVALWVSFALFLPANYAEELTPQVVADLFLVGAVSGGITSLPALFVLFHRRLRAFLREYHLLSLASIALPLMGLSGIAMVAYAAVLWYHPAMWSKPVVLLLVGALAAGMVALVTAWFVGVVAMARLAAHA